MAKIKLSSKRHIIISPSKRKVALKKANAVDEKKITSKKRAIKAKAKK